MQRVEKLLPLAPKALSSPHLYDPALRVDIQLDAPLWVPGSGLRQIAADMMGLCVQLDSILMTSGLAQESDIDPAAGRKVSFEKECSSKAAVVLEKMKELLRRNSQEDDIDTYLRESGISYLFPRLEYYIQGEDVALETVSTPLMDGYFSHLTSLHNVLTLSQQLNTDILTSHSHKYVAHQLALLYQSIGQVPQLAHYKKSIESKFSAIKMSCTAQATGHPPRLTPDLQRWLVDLTQRLVEQTSSLNPELLHSTQQANIHEVLTVFERIQTSQT